LEKIRTTAPSVHTDKDNSAFVNILIIEDECARSTVVNLGLHYEYCHTVLAHDTRKGFECLEAMPEIQVVIAANTTPPSKGLERVIKIRAHPRWKRIPVILILAKADPEITQQANQLGCQHVIARPFKAGRLLAKIDLVLLENSFKTPDCRRVPVRGAIFQPLHHRVARLAVRTYQRARKRLEKKTMIATANERSKPIKGFLHRQSKRSYTTVADWLSKELRLIRRVKPHLKVRHKIVTLAEWVSGEIRMIRSEAFYRKTAKKKYTPIEKPPQPAPMQDAVNTVDTAKPFNKPPVKPDIQLNIQYLVLFRKAPYLFSKAMQKQILNSISKDQCKM